MCRERTIQTGVGPTNLASVAVLFFSFTGLRRFHVALVGHTLFLMDTTSYNCSTLIDSFERIIPGLLFEPRGMFEPWHNGYDVNTHTKHIHTLLEAGSFAGCRRRGRKR